MDCQTITDVARAVTATAETASKALELTCSLGKVVKGPVEQLVGMLEDRVKYARWERQRSYAEKAAQVMRDKGLQVPTRELPLKFAVPLLTHAFLEEDDELQMIWARLLVNAGDASTNMELRVAYISILNGLSAFDVRNLSLLARASIEAPENGHLAMIQAWNLPVEAKVHPESSTETGLISEELGISLGNLNRLGCAAPSYGWGGMANFQLMTVTDLGRALYRACS